MGSVGRRVGWANWGCARHAPRVRRRHEQKFHRPSSCVVARDRHCDRNSAGFWIFMVCCLSLSSGARPQAASSSAHCSTASRSAGSTFLVASGFTLIFGLDAQRQSGARLALSVWRLFRLRDGEPHRKLDLQPDRDLRGRRVARHAVAVHDLPLDGGAGLSQTLVTIAISLILADSPALGEATSIRCRCPRLGGPVLLVTAVRSSGELVYLQYPLVRLVILLGAIVIGVAMWLALNRTKIGMLVRAGVDDRDMLSATGIRVQLIFILVLALRCRPCRLYRRCRRHFPVAASGEDIKISLARWWSSSSAAWARSPARRSARC